MTGEVEDIGILGAGAFGTALAIGLARDGTRVRLWGRDRVTMQAAERTRRLPRLPKAVLPAGIMPTGDIGDLADCPILVVAIPMQKLSDALDRLPFSPRRVIAACKGIDLATGRGPTAILLEALPGATPAILSGPSFAADIARGLPTALSIGCADDLAGAELQRTLATSALRLYRTTDIIGVEAGGALKNVVAIACGAAIGAGLGESARAALMTRGMSEMMRLATSLGARRETLMGLSGLGDLALTCASPQSRNFALGYAIGRGAPRPDATTEGVATSRAVIDLAETHGIEVPVTAAVEGLVDGRLSVEDAVRDLLSRDLRPE